MTPLALFLSAFTATVGIGLVTWLLWQSWVEAGDGALAELDEDGGVL